MQARASSTIERLDNAKKKLQKYQQKRNINPLASHESLSHNRYASSASTTELSTQRPVSVKNTMHSSSPMLSVGSPKLDVEAVLVEQSSRDYEELEVISTYLLF
jgi:hypothetical protein